MKKFIRSISLILTAAILTLPLLTTHGSAVLSKSKTAAQLDSSFVSRVSLSIPSSEEPLTTDVVFILDKSTSASLISQALDMLTVLRDRAELTGAEVRVGVIIFNKTANVFNNGKFFDLKEQYAEIEAAISQEVKSGTNTHAGLLAGKGMLDSDIETDASRKYMIFISDGISYMYGSDPEIAPYYWMNDGSPYFSIDPYSWQFKYGTNAPPSDWAQWLAETGATLENETVISVPYSSKSELNTGNATDVTGTSPGDYTTSVDRALYYSYLTYKSAADAGYHCYAVSATEYNGSYEWGPSFMNYLSGGKSLSFSDIQNDILYLVGPGSRVIDHIGFVEGDYDFDFIDDAEKLSIKIGDTEFHAVKLSEGHYGFADNGSGYDYELFYEPGDLKAEEHFVWQFNVPVSNFSPVTLTYSVKLKNPKSAPGTYGEYDRDGVRELPGLFTNSSAVLYPVDSNGAAGAPEPFARPTVSYTVSNTVEPVIPSGLNTSELNKTDHIAYIIGFPDNTVRPNSDITRAQSATIFFRLLTNETRAVYWCTDNPYGDVSPEAWYNNAISTLTNMGILDGYEDGTFRPDEPVTRAELTKMAVSFFDYSDADGTRYTFPDTDSSAWYTRYISAAAALGLVQGDENGLVRPNAGITRAETCTLINRVLERTPHNAGLLPEEYMLTWCDNSDVSAWYYAAIQEATNSHDYTRTDSSCPEQWTEKLPERDWAALERLWSTAYSAPGQDVVD